MLLNNYKKWLQTLVVGKRDVRTKTGIFVKDINRNDLELIGPYYVAGGNFTDDINNSPISFSVCSLRFGSNDGPVSRDDYTVEEVSNLYWSRSLASYSVSKETGHLSSTFTYLLRNDSTTSNVKIAEVGYGCYLYGFKGTSYTSSFVLLDRTLLSAPVILAPGETSSITVNIENQFAR